MIVSRSITISSKILRFIPISKRHHLCNFTCTVDKTIKMTLNPRESGEFIVKHAKHLSIDPNGIQNLVEKVRIINHLIKRLLTITTVISLFISYRQKYKYK